MKAFRAELLVWLILFLASDCVMHLKVSHADQPVRIGWIGPLSGPLGQAGSSAKKGVELAVAEINVAGGIRGKKVEVLYMDTQGFPDLAMKSAEWLAHQKGLIGILGDLTSSGIEASMQISARHKIPMITYYGSAIEPAQYNNPWFFTVSLRTQELYKGLANYCIRKQNLKKYATMILDNAYGETNKVGFEKGVELTQNAIIVLEARYDIANKDFIEEISKIKAIKPEAIVLIGLSQDSALIAKQLGEAMIDIPILGSVPQSSRDFYEIAGKGAEGMILANYFHEGAYDWENSKTFISLWNQKHYSKSPDVYAANAYDAVGMMAAAVKDMGTDKYDVMGWLKNTEWKGASGLIRTRPDRMEKTFVLQKWQKGELVLADTDIVKLSE
ncbi:MAG: ABC transporter substrate-binding protein [Candidatus Hodarchaeota archaeon]